MSIANDDEFIGTGTVEERVLEIIKDVSQADIALMARRDVSLTDTLRGDLDINELDECELDVRLEEEFDIELPDEWYGPTTTVKDVIVQVKRNL